MIRYKKERREIVEMNSKDLLESYIKLYRRELPKNFGVALDRVSTTFFEFSSLDNPEDTVRLPYSILSSGVVEMDMTPLGGRNAAPMTLRAASGNRWDVYENIKYLGRALKSHFAENKKEESRRYESRTTDVWKEIVAKIKKDARARKLVIADSKLNSLTLADKNDPNKAVKLDVDLMNTGSGECIVSLGKKTWKMGDTQIRDRSMKGGTKTPDMSKQIENILDMVEFTMGRK